MSSKPSKKQKVEEPSKGATAKTNSCAGPEEKKSKPRKGKEPTTFSALPKETDIIVPVDIKFEGLSVQANPAKDGTYAHTLKLMASNSFSLTKTIVLTSGEYEGQQAILLMPAKAFPFQKLDPEIRARIYKYYLVANEGSNDAGIALDGKRNNTKNLFAKTYANGSKNRVALLAVSREIHAEAVHLLYSQTLRFDSTANLLDFFAQTQNSVRGRLISIAVKTFAKSTARNALGLLAEASQLQKLHIDGGIFNELDASKAAKAFWNEASKLLITLSTAKGDPKAAVDVLSFGKTAFIHKDDKGKVRTWDEETIAAFRSNLVMKLKSLQIPLVRAERGFRAYGTWNPINGTAEERKLERMMLGFWD